MICVDFCGPMKITLVFGVRYFLLFVDDFTRKTWVYFLELKSKVFIELKNLKGMVEKESWTYIQISSLIMVEVLFHGI